MTFLAVRMGAVVLLLGIIIVLTRPAWPSRTGALHSAVTGLLVHGAPGDHLHPDAQRRRRRSACVLVED